eukprot:m.867356 g.867356  ORF g.867356 m.867356 type:complete len:1326 (+) comp59728_c0_seq2:80-4057(+)
MRGFAVVFAALIAWCHADIYLHNMRGSNNRLDEANRDRDNANRLFDSQNNNRGGYNVGKLFFYEGEIVPFEWTNQHGCGNGYNKCDLVVQVMCGPNVRDGATTTTIPEQPSNCANNDCNNDDRFGMHEDYDYYMNCKYRSRNAGLFTADRNLNGQTARFTRQNENGNRRGYECPEERDHYPYWHPSPWVDVAIFTNDPSRCDYYRNETENLVGRHYCWIPDAFYHSKVSQGGNGNQGFIPNTEAKCLKLNAKGEPLMTFMTTQSNVEYATLQSTVAAEFARCNDAVDSAVTQCNLLGTQAAINSCIARFVSTSTISEDALAAAVPSCIAGSQFPELHPSGSVCPVCLQAGCAAKIIPTNTSITSNNGCPDGFAIDPFSAGSCLPTNCLTTSTFESMKDVDARRAAYLKANSKVLVNGTQAQCVQRATLTQDCYNSQIKKAQWVRADPHQAKYPFLEAPICAQNLWSRPNHLGNGVNGFQNGFNLSIPSFNQENCVARLRYNITTADYNNLDPYNSGQVNSSLNKQGNDQSARIRINEYHGIPTSDSANPWTNARGYLFKNNPRVQIFDFTTQVRYCNTGTLVAADPTSCVDANGKRTLSQATFCPMPFPVLRVNAATGQPLQPLKCVDNATNPSVAGFDPSTTDRDFTLQLAINTAQLGRTFQDRTHTFDVAARNVSTQELCNNMYSLNVRGKRGNIVQTYPGTEYDFVPNRLHVAEGDCIHFQWTGSNTNPNNNDGQGKEGTDRSNVALTENVRGQGGRGVNNYGGFGRAGTTWTTKGQEPGLEPWTYMAQPTMADIQCNWTFPTAHPTEWKFCALPRFNRTTGAPLCEWKARPFTNTSLPNGGRNITWGACDTNFTIDSLNQKLCVRTVCQTGGYWPRTPNPTRWGPNDTLDGSIWGTPDALKFGAFGMNHPEHLDNVTRWGFLGLNRDQLIDLAILDNVQLGGELSELDDAGTYFNLDPHQVSGVGTYFYMCTRNNNFSNRGQKGKIIVSSAPETGASIGSNGGAVGVSANTAFMPMTASKAFAKNDYAISVPKQSVPIGVTVQMKVLSPDASKPDVLWVGPSTLSAIKQFSSTRLTNPSRRAASVLGEDTWIDVSIQDATHIAYRIHGPSVQAIASPTLPVTVIFVDSEGNKLYQSVQPFNGNREIADVWLTSMAVVQLLERGQLTISITAGQDTVSAPLLPVPGSGSPLQIKMPISVSIAQGKVYHWAEDPNLKDCVAQAGSVMGCNFRRTEIANPVFKSGYVTFSVGGSVASPAGGYYQVEPGSNVGLIVGVTAACVCVTLIVVLSAIYFRKRPEQWAAFKAWGPNTMKGIKRSLASSV